MKICNKQKKKKNNDVNAQSVAVKAIYRMLQGIREVPDVQKENVCFLLHDICLFECNC